MEGNTILSLSFVSAGATDDLMTKRFQQLCDDITRLHQCQAILHVSLGTNVSNSISSTLATTKTFSSIDTRHTPVLFNVTLSGEYQRVMNARGAILRNSPLKAKLSIPVSKTLISSPESNSWQDIDGDTESPSPAISTSATANAAQNPDTYGTNSVEKADADTQSQTLTSSSQSATKDGPIKESTSSISWSMPSSFAPTITLNPQFRTAVDRISVTTKTGITLLSSSIDATACSSSVKAIFARQDMVELQVTGSWENAEAARVLLLVAIDTLQPGVVSDKLQVELKYQNMIGGRKRQDLQDLMARTSTSIYMTSPFVQTANKSGCPVDPRYNDIYITGEAKQVVLAKEALARAYLRAQAASMSCTREVDIATRKLDWMLQNHREKLRAIMLDNASFIAFPPLGGTHPSIFVYGESNVNVERTIRTVMQLCGSITRRDTALSMHMPHTIPSIINICKVISQASGAEVEYRNNGFLMFGNEIQTRTAMQFLVEVDLVKTLPFEFKFTVELANEHREFISGKKNGKINRIMKATGARIKFDQCNGYNFYVDLGSTIAAKTMEALALLQEELPAEISFYVPETYHKRIIGVGGKNIQRIMKKYGVYVKFSNSEEFAILGGYFDNQDNVVARTPSKNAVNLENLKQAVMEFVGPKDKDFVRQNLIIPKQDHLSLLSHHADVLRQIYEDTNAAILFPERETGSDVVTVCGPELYVQQAITLLLSMVQERFMFLVPYSEEVYRVLDMPEYTTEVVNVIKQAWNITLIMPPFQEQIHGTVTPQLSSPAAPIVAKTGEQALDQKKADISAADDGDQSIEQREESKQTPGNEESKSALPKKDLLFVFEYTRNNEDSLLSAKELFTRFLARHRIEVNEDEIQVPRLRPESNIDVFLQSRKPSTIGAGAASGPSFGLGPLPSIGQSTGSPNAYTRVASLPSDPWAPAPNKHHQRQSQTSGSFLGSIGDLRLTPPGMSNTPLTVTGAHGSGYYSSSPYTQYPIEGAYSKAPGFQTPTSMSTGNRYSGGNSPVHGATGGAASFETLMGHHQGSLQNSSPQRQQIMENSSSRGSMQYLEEKMFSGSAFGPGYGPSLNSGSTRSAHQQQHMSYQQQPFPSQTYSSHLSLQPGLAYPHQRQRHSSQNSAASHHTMGLGPIGSGPGSAGGSVNSDEISTEDDSDEVFDEMRNRHKAHTVGNHSALFKPRKQSQLAGGSGSSYEIYSSHNSSSSSLFNRRGSGGSTHSNSIQQQQQQQYFSSGSMDLYGQNGLMSAMEKHSLNGHHNNHQQDVGDMSISGGRSLQGRLVQTRQSGSNSGQVVNAGLPGLTAGSRFEDDRGFFTSGFGGIIGEGAHGYGRLSSSSPSNQGLGLQQPTQSYDSSFGGGLHGGSSHNAFDSFRGREDLNVVGDEAVRSGALDSSEQSASSSLAFYLDPTLHHGQSANRINEGSRVAGWGH
ncbi:hypothetical protein BGX28_002525 [Mortierella sp. GBA30]|nr:hypothetical protein BGX28_002525 [Mortierella sp. GBA30]